jgi:hypothetical protein
MDFCQRTVQAEGQQHDYLVDDFLWAYSMVHLRFVTVPELQPLSITSQIESSDSQF